MNAFLVRFAAVAIVAVTLAPGCRGPTDDRVPVVQFDRKVLALSPGDSARVMLLPMLPPGYVPGVIWRTSNATVATVTNGVVRAVAPGTATITANGAGAGDTAVVVVGTGSIPVVQLATRSARIALGDTVSLFLLPMLPPGYVPPVTWSSSDSGVASVTVSTGRPVVVHGLHAGHAVITAAGGGMSDTCGVTVH